MTLRRLLAPLAVGAAAFIAQAHDARATIVERVVAVIGERPVLWTDLLRRAAASRLQIRMQTRDENVVSAQEQEMYKELVDRMIDDKLEEQQGDRAHISIAQEEIDRGLANIAAQASQTQGRAVAVAEVLAEVRRRGMTEQDFRDEIRRQLLEGKLIELRVRPRVRVTEQDGRAAYQRWAAELREEQPVDVRWIVMRVPSGSTEQFAQGRMALAQQIVGWARGGQDFCQLVRTYTDDTATRDTCGSRGPQRTAQLPPAVQQAVRTSKAGAVSDPIVMPNGTEQVILIVMPMGAARVPPYEDVKNEMMQRALLDGLERARKQWLQELRHNVYIDVRL